MFRLFQEDIRAADADREQTVETLKRHYADGRLSSEELSSRVDAAYAAIGLLELESLTRDLPPLPESATREAGRSGRRAGTMFVASLSVMGMLVIASAIPPDVWALLLFFGLPIVMMGLFMLLPVALPVLAMAWLSRSLDPGREERPRRLGRGSGWTGTWHFEEPRARRHRAGHGSRRRGLFDF